MSRHQRFAAALLLTAATLGLGACSNPTGLSDYKDPPAQPLCAATKFPETQPEQVHARLIACENLP